MQRLSFKIKKIVTSLQRSAILRLPNIFNHHLLIICCNVSYNRISLEDGIGRNKNIFIIFIKVDRVNINSVLQKRRDPGRLCDLYICRSSGRKKKSL